MGRSAKPKSRRADEAAVEPEVAPILELTAPEAAAAEDLFTLAAAPPPTPASPAPPALVSDRTARGKSGGGIGTKLAKPGFGFHMRTADGEETVAPYASLEDLLSAAKNVLRGAAKSPETVWFSIQPLDLASIDSEAA